MRQVNGEVILVYKVMINYRLTIINLESLESVKYWISDFARLQRLDYNMLNITVKHNILASKYLVN